MARILVIIGPECSGKSSLTKLLESNLKLPASEEYARIYSQNVNRPLNETDIRPIVEGQLELENRLERDNPDSPFLLMDTNLLSSLIYSDWYFSKRPDWLEEIILKRTYDEYFLCLPEIPWIQDQSRGKDDNRKEMLEFFRSELKRRNIQFKLLQGKQDEREKFMTQFISNIS